jgi:hypothetical protein
VSPKAEVVEEIVVAAPVRSVAMRPSWEDEAFAEGKAILVLHPNGTIQRVTCALELEPLDTTRLTRAELSRAQRIMADVDARRRAGV